MSATTRIAMSFGVAVVMLAMNAWLLTRGTAFVVRFLSVACIGVAYAVTIVVWQSRRARR
jgi:hypothetical protein